MITPEELTKRLEAGFSDSQIQVRDYAGDNNHFEAIIVSKDFESKNRVQRHQMVYKVLGDAMDEEIHALALKTMTPEEFQKL